MPLWALLGVLLERSWGFFEASWAVLEASWAILAALVASQVRLGSHLGHLGRLGERQGRVLAPTEPRGSCEGTRAGGGGPLRRLQKPYQTALGILARLNVPGGTVAEFDCTSTSREGCGLAAIATAADSSNV